MEESGKMVDLSISHAEINILTYFLANIPTQTRLIEILITDIQIARKEFRYLLDILKHSIRWSYSWITSSL